MRVGDLDQLVRASGDEPDNLGLRVQLAGALREAGRGQEAIELYRSVAMAYRDQGRAQQAIAVCRSLLEIAPGDGACQALLASLTESSVKTRAATLPPIERPKRPATIQIPPKLRPPTDAPARRSSLDATPLPEPVPYHVADPSQPRLPQKRSDDIAAELDTRELVKVDARQLAKLGPPAPAIDEAASTLRRIEPFRDDVPEDSEDEPTSPRDFPVGIQDKDPLDGAFFAPLPAERRAAVMSRMFKRVVRPGSFVIRHGETLHPLFVVVRGLLEVRGERPNGEVVTLGHARDGEFVGEAALLSHTPSTIQVIAATEADLLALNPKDFYDVAGAFPALWARLKDVAERRTRDYDVRMKR